MAFAGSGRPEEWTTSARSMNWSWASAMMRSLSREGWKEKSKPSSVLMAESRAVTSAILMRRFSRKRELFGEQGVDGLRGRSSRRARCRAA